MTNQRGASASMGGAGCSGWVEPAPRSREMMVSMWRVISSLPSSYSNSSNSSRSPELCIVEMDAAIMLDVSNAADCISSVIVLRALKMA